MHVVKMVSQTAERQDIGDTLPKQETKDEGVEKPEHQPMLDKDGPHTEKCDVSPPRPVAPDGGWGWMVVLGCTGMHLFLAGLNKSYGVVYIELRRKFGSSAAITAWVGGLAAAIRFAASELSNNIFILIAGTLVRENNHSMTQSFLGHLSFKTFKSYSY